MIKRKSYSELQKRNPELLVLGNRKPETGAIKL